VKNLKSLAESGVPTTKYCASAGAEKVKELGFVASRALLDPYGSNRRPES
jgi:hypothetical protein